MKKIWQAWLPKTKSISCPPTSTTIDPAASTTEEASCTPSGGNADEVILSKKDVNTIEPELALNTDMASLIANKKCIAAKLLNTNKRDFTGNPRYENLDFVNKGDIVNIGYLDETKTYLVIDSRSNELGEISNSASSIILESRENNIIAIVDNITENDQGKRSISINVYI